MSTPPPPPSSNPNFPGPPGAPPPGYTPYVSGAVGTVQPSKGVSKAMIVLFWCTTAAAALAGFALYSRKGVWDDFINGTKTPSDVNDADSLVGTVLLLQIALALASAIVCAVWSNRIAKNAKARGAVNVSPGLAAGGWFIPIGWLWVGFGQLRKSVEGVGGRSPSLGRWQALFVSQALVGILVNRFGDFNNVADEDMSDRLRNQGLIGLIGAVIYAVTTIFAMKAAREIDTAVTGA